MSALEKLLMKSTKNYTPLEAAVVFLSGTHSDDSHKAAEQLAAKDAVIKAARAYLEHGFTSERLNLHDVLIEHDWIVTKVTP